MTARTYRSATLLALSIAFAGCTRLKPVATPSTPVEVASSALPGSDVPVAFPSESAAPVPPTPTPVPAPQITLSEPTTQTDFSASEVTVAFTAVAAPGRKIKSARVLYDNREIVTLDGEGPSFRVEKWNPNVENNLSDPPLSQPVRSGNHTLMVAATDDQGLEGKIEVGIFKQLKVTGWQELASMPGPTSHHHAFSDGAVPPSFVSLWGSIDGIETTVVPRSEVYGFSPVGDGKWTTLVTNGNSVPRAGYGLAAHPSGQLFYLAGGRTGAQDLRTLDLYAPLRKVREQALVSMTTARFDPSAAFVDGHLYVLGGSSAGAAQYAVERVKIAADGAPEGEFTAMADLQNARVGATALVQGKEIWVFGGGHRPIEVYDTAANTWRFLTDPAGTAVGTPETWAHSAMVPVGERVFFFGGQKEDGQAIDRVYEFNPTTKAWRELGPMPSITGEDPATRPLSRVSAFFHEGAFYLLGGQTLPGRRPSTRVFRGATL